MRHGVGALFLILGGGRSLERGVSLMGQLGVRDVSIS